MTAHPSPPLDAPLSGEATSASWLADFHAGERACLAGCYRDTFDAVYQTVGRILKGADQETVVHEVFYRLLAEERLRRSFQGGSLQAWLRTMARNQAIDFARRRGFEIPVEKTLAAEPPAAEGGLGSQLERQVEARLLLARIRELLPEKWRPVFDARFIQQRDQPDAARSSPRGAGTSSLSTRCTSASHCRRPSTGPKQQAKLGDRRRQRQMLHAPTHSHWLRHEIALLTLRRLVARLHGEPFADVRRDRGRRRRR